MLCRNVAALHDVLLDSSADRGKKPHSWQLRHCGLLAAAAELQVHIVSLQMFSFYQPVQSITTGMSGSCDKHEATEFGS